MPRIARLIDTDQPTIYHIISRTVLDGFPMGADEKDYLVSVFKKYTQLYFTDVFGYCAMGDHFHLVIRMYPPEYYDEEEIVARLKGFYGEHKNFNEEQVAFYREKLSNLSTLVKEVKQTFSRFYNIQRGRNGFFWDPKFKSVIVEPGEALVNLLAYIELNPIRAKIVERPENYTWSSFGYHSQTNNNDNWLNTEFDFFDESFCYEELMEKYKAFIYEKGRLGKKKKKLKPDEREYFTIKTRWFSDSRVIGSKAFIEKYADKFEDYFHSKHKKQPIPIKGLNFYSMVRLGK